MKVLIKVMFWDPILRYVDVWALHGREGSQYLKYSVGLMALICRTVESMANFEAVLFDWRGTLVVNLSTREWIERSLDLFGRGMSVDAMDELEGKIEVAENLGELDAPGVDCDARRHRNEYMKFFIGAGLDQEMAEAFYRVESSAEFNPFADDAFETMNEIKSRGIQIAIVSDIHFDVRPAFVAAHVDKFIDYYVLSFEHAVQKPDPAIFAIALEMLDRRPSEVLMVGDRSVNDGAAVESGIVTLLLPSLVFVGDRRLHLVRELLGI